MTKPIESHAENNFRLKNLSVIKAQEALSRMLDPKVLPFYEDWKNNSQNSSKNASKPASILAFSGSSDIIKNNENLSREVPSYYLHEDYVELCKKYHIPYKAVYHNYRELDKTEELVAEYADLLKDAKSLGITWDTSTFDIEGLREAIDEARNEYYSEEAEQEYFAEARSNRWAYYSGLGVL